VSRIALIDIARTAALGAMIVFHFTYDLELFGHIPAGTLQRPEWIWFARCIAGSFIFVSGVSLVVAALHGPLNRRKFAKRLVLLGLAAAAVTAGTYFAMGAAGSVCARSSPQ